MWLIVQDRWVFLKMELYQLDESQVIIAFVDLTE